MLDIGDRRYRTILTCYIQFLVCPKFTGYNLKLSDENMRGGGGADINTGYQLRGYKHHHLAQYPPTPSHLLPSPLPSHCICRDIFR